jgi:LysR substrate binding domain
VREGVDLALRLGPLSDSSMKLRTLGQSRRLLVAAPDYLVARGRPVAPQDLAGHEGIRMSNIAGSDTLVLQGPDEHHAVPFGGRFRVDHGLGAREALVARRGIAPAHRWLVDDLLAAGRLEAILPDYEPPPVPLSLLIVPERAGIARVRLLVDFLAGQIAEFPASRRLGLGASRASPPNLDTVQAGQMAPTLRKAPASIGYPAGRVRMVRQHQLRALHDISNIPMVPDEGDPPVSPFQPDEIAWLQPGTAFEDGNHLATFQPGRNEMNRLIVCIEAEELADLGCAGAQWPHGLAPWSSSSQRHWQGRLEGRPRRR